MLELLRIKDFALIDDVDTELKPGLNVMTGETGAGKSIIVTALNLVLGMRASSEVVRTGCTEARIEALFNIEGDRRVVELLDEHGYKLGNADMTVIAQAPKLAPHIEDMRANLAGDLRVEVDQINVKATTTEMLGFAGRKEGIAAHAVVLLTR